MDHFIGDPDVASSTPDDYTAMIQLYTSIQEEFLLFRHPYLNLLTDRESRMQCVVNALTHVRDYWIRLLQRLQPPYVSTGQTSPVTTKVTPSSLSIQATVKVRPSSGQVASTRRRRRQRKLKDGR